MPAATRLGLDYESLRPINPRIIYSHVSAYGPVGPRKDWPGYDQLFQAQCGWEVAGAGEGNPPIWHRFGMMDHQAAMASLYATLLGLLHREKTGEGQAVSASLLGASMQTLSETVLLSDGRPTPVDQLDHEQLGVSNRKRLYACADGFVAAVATDRDPSTNESLGRPNHPASPADELIEDLAQSSVADALDKLRTLGFTAVPVRINRAKAFLTNAAYQASGLVAEYNHPRYGRLRQPGAFWYFKGVAPEFKCGPPERGEHSEEILAEIGFTRNEIDALIDCEAIACS